MPIKQSLNAFVKAGHSSTALALRSGKAVLCFLLAHIHDNHEFSLKAWNKGIFTLAEFVKVVVTIKPN